jgi:hypothetical protein
MTWKKTRWLLAAGCLLLSWKLMAAVLRVDGFSLDALSAAPSAIFSVASFVTAVFLMAPETAFWAAEVFSRPFVAILFPSDHFSRPPLTYRLARYYRDVKRWKDAARQYRKIIRYYPKERDAYVELLDVAEKMHDEELHQEYTRLFRKRFRKEHPQQVT